MLYEDKQYISDKYIEHETHCIFDYGAKGLKRLSKKKATPLQIQKQNHWNKVKNCRRTIQLNFSEGDLWCTFAYRKGTRKDMREFIRDIRRFTNLLRVEYQKQGKDLKWIRRLEIGKRGGLHAHFILNKADTKLISDTWRKAVKDSGRAHFEVIDDEDGYNGLAEYICKEPTEEIQGQMTFLVPEDKKKLCSISTSRNLVRPEAVRKQISAWKIARILTGKEEIVPTEGYSIEQDTVRIGFNKFTHLPYIRYREKIITDSCDCRPQKCEQIAKTQIICPETQIKNQISKAGTEIIKKAKGILGSIKDRWRR